MSSVLENLTHGFVAFVEEKTRNAPRFGIKVTAAAEGGREIFLTFAFRSGHRYCCSASSCHHGLLYDFDFQRLRECFNETGVDVPRPMVVHMNVVCEGGALFALEPGDPHSDYDPIGETLMHEERYDEREAWVSQRPGIRCIRDY